MKANFACHGEIVLFTPYPLSNRNSLWGGGGRGRGNETKNTHVENYIRLFERKVSAIIPIGLET